MPDQEPRPSANPQTGHVWAVVLAAGEGSRLQSLTTMKSGVAVPKQFCSFGGGASLLHDALARAASVVPPERACVVVAEHHTQWWQGLASAVTPENIIVQPGNRGTAVGILLPLLHILQRDPEASVVVLPSDHYVQNETILATRLRQAAAEVERGRDRIILLGLTPDEADPELGYIVPEGMGGPILRAVSQFVEKPCQLSAGKLIDRGGLWNSFIFAARGQTLLQAFEKRCPEIVRRLREIIVINESAASKQARLRLLYEQLPSLDFSRDILETSLDQLEVLTVPACGWSDLGTPRRVAQALARNDSSVGRESRSAVAAGPGFLDLAAQILLTRNGARHLL